MTICAGVAAYPEDGVVAKQLYLRSERALKAAKMKGRNFCVRFHPSMERKRRVVRETPKETF